MWFAFSSSFLFDCLVVCCLLFNVLMLVVYFVGWCVLFGVCCLFLVVCSSLFVACNVLFAVCSYVCRR